MSWHPIAGLLSSAAPDARPVAFGDAGEAMTLAELRRDVAAATGALQALRPEAALLVAADTYRFAVGMLAALHSGTKLILPPAAQAAAWIAGRKPGTALVSDAQPAGTVPDVDLRALPGLDAPPRPLDAEAARIVFCTSGSTGEPKQVDKRLVHLEREIATLERCFGAGADGARVHSTVANHHIYGILFYVLWPLARGLPFARRPAEHWGPLLEAVDSNSILISSPAHLTRLQDADTLPAARRPRLVFSSGGLLPFPAATEAERVLGQRPVEVFGSTETGGVAWRRQVAAQTPWQLFPDAKAEPSEEGLLRVRSPLFDEPHIDMGDRASFDTDGRFNLLGRADRIVKIEAVRVSLGEIEACLQAMPGVGEAAALLLPGPRDAIGAVIAPTAEARGSFAAMSRSRLLRQVRQVLLGKVPPVAMPRRLRVVDQLPVNSQGKRVQAELSALFATPNAVMALGAGGPVVTGSRPIEHGCEIDLSVPKDAAVFAGHFPGYPVLAGVAQIDWVFRLAKLHLGLQADFAGFRVLKFRRVVSPGTQLQLRVQHRDGRLAFDLLAGAGSVSSGEILLAAR